jgi:hypothetical protein
MNKFLLNVAIVGVLISGPLVPVHITTPQALSEWFYTEGFSYQAELPFHDYWKKPEETIRDKGGDCEDFAFLVDRVLSERGYKTYVLAVYFPKSAHAITIIKIDEKYTMFSNMSYLSYKFATIEGLLGFYYPEWKYYREIRLPKWFGPKTIKD